MGITVGFAVLNFGKVNNVLMGVEYEMQNVGCADASLSCDISTSLEKW